MTRSDGAGGGPSEMDGTHMLKRLRARQTEVSVSTDAARPEVALGDHFRRLDRRMGELDESMSLTHKQRR